MKPLRYAVLAIFFIFTNLLFSFTYQNKDGNPFVEGKGHLSRANHLDISLKGQPKLISSISANGVVYSLVLLENGTSQLFKISNGQYTDISLLYNLPVSSSGQPLLRLKDGIPEPHYNSVFLEDGTVVRHYKDGRLIIGSRVVLSDALPDGKILTDEKNRILLLASPTDIYKHGALGDNIEAASVVLIETKPQIAIKRIITIRPPQVIEGLKPLWVDLNSDGKREIIVTLSDQSNGAGLAVYNEEGRELASGPFIGRGYRWRHQLTAGPMGPHGEIEILDVLTPHIGGPLEYFRWKEQKLELVSTIKGYTSHFLGSNNLDMSVAGDFNGNNINEILIPSYDRKTLGAIERYNNGSSVSYVLDLGSSLVTNISSFSMDDGTISIAVGMENNTLRIWLP